jgi:glucosamine--fructose-6-phosphate aminotransferase (isomerizing)
MNLKDERTARFALVREMQETVEVIRTFDPRRTAAVAAEVAAAGRLLLTGEGSSRIFPAKNAIRRAMTWGADLRIGTEGSRQAAGYDLADWAVFCASNSGRTKEVVTLARALGEEGNARRYALTANEGTVLGQACAGSFTLACGWEQATAATKSVVEQALFYESIVRHAAGRPFGPALGGLADRFAQALALPIDPALTAKALAAPTLYFAGPNDGVAEELALKTNEIARKKSDFLEGTYAVHGVEEVMDAADVVFVIDPYEAEIEKFQEVLVKGVGLTVVAVADRDTPFPTVRVPSGGEGNPYLFLAAGWNLLVEIGLAAGIDLDKPQRARKVGNEVAG